MNVTALSVHGFMPHGMCYLWRPEILWLHVGSDLLTALAYFSIPAAMYVFASRRPDLAYRPIVWLFVAFIVLCGATHLMAIWTVWVPDYFLSGLLKALTALASVATAIVLWPLLPRALALPSTHDLASANDELRSEIRRRSVVEAELKSLTGELESRVADRTAALERANEALNQFAGVASHDLRAPVRHVSVFAELLEREEGEALSEQGRETLGRIKRSAERMQTLVDGLLEYARLVNTPPSSVALDLGAIARHAVETHQPALDAAGVKVSMGELPTAVGDPVLIERVFDNLIANALKYGSTESPEIAISGERPPGGFVKVAVTDNGPGVPADQREKVFEMLHRLSSDPVGLGVGLAFCRTIIESHGGTISCDGGFAKGARFVFTLPAPS